MRHIRVLESQVEGKALRELEENLVVRIDEWRDYRVG